MIAAMFFQSTIVVEVLMICKQYEYLAQNQNLQKNGLMVLFNVTRKQEKNHKQKTKAPKEIKIYKRKRERETIIAQIPNSE